jgi:hypothetical protein
MTEETKPGVWQLPPQGMTAIYETLLQRGAPYSRRFGKFQEDRRAGRLAMENNDLIRRFNAGEQWCAREFRNVP